MGIRSGIVMAAIALMALAGCDKAPSKESASPAKPAGSSAERVRIAVIPKGSTHDFWKSVHAGALKAAAEFPGIEIVFRGPEREDDREQQISLVQNLVSGGYKSIVLAPLDRQALLAPVRQATAASIPVIIIDSGLDGDVGKDFVSFIATDNFQGGKLGGEHMAAKLGGKGTVLLLRYQEGSASTTEREQGFLEAMKAAGITVIDQKRYAGATRATAQEASENLLTVHANVDGVFCPNESSTFGMLLALRSRGLAGKKVFVGFDASEGLVEALSKGDIEALVVQNPVQMGYLGVKAAYDTLQGRKVEPRIDTGVVVATRENMGTAEIKGVLSPDLSSLGGAK